MCVYVTVFSTTSKNHQRALDAMQINLETESRNKVEAMRVKKKLEQDINDLEMTLDGVNKAKAETERNFKKYQQQIRDLQQVHYVTLRYGVLQGVPEIRGVFRGGPRGPRPPPPIEIFWLRLSIA